jgi:vancomycin resistance protein VanJ
LCIATIFIFSFQPDACAAVLVLPRWLWIAPGLVLALIACTRPRKRMTAIAVGLWLLYAICFVQEFRSLIRSGPKQIPEFEGTSGKAIRVISLNCAAGDEKAAAEVANYNPDIVLFQESPLRPIVQRLAPKILGPDAQVLAGYDVSLISRGKLTAITPGNAQSAPFGHARIELPSGLVVEVFSIRLHPYGIRADVWSPGCWREQRENRIHQREQFQWLAREVEKVPADVPVILGGDFNLPAGDKLFRILPPRIRDTFRTAGHGWGDTLANDIPFIRIDQIWCDNHFRPISTAAQKTVNSDHRMVICDLLIAEK